MKKLDKFHVYVKKYMFKLQSIWRKNPLFHLPNKLESFMTESRVETVIER